MQADTVSPDRAPPPGVGDAGVRRRRHATVCQGDPDGVAAPIAWARNWAGEERERMTRRDGDAVTLDPAMLGRRAVIAGHDVAGKSGRYRHARWLDGVSLKDECVAETPRDELAGIATEYECGGHGR